MFCSKCGMELPDDAKFCLKCGVSLNEKHDVIKQFLEYSCGGNKFIARTNDEQTANDIFKYLESIVINSKCLIIEKDALAWEIYYSRFGLFSSDEYKLKDACIHLKEYAIINNWDIVQGNAYSFKRGTDVLQDVFTRK